MSNGALRPYDSGAARPGGRVEATAGAAGTGKDGVALGRLVEQFVQQTPGVTDAVAVSSDGLLLAASAELLRDDAEQLAAIIAGIVSLAKGASHHFHRKRVRLVLIETDGGLLVVSAVSGGSAVGVLAARDADVGAVGYAIGTLAQDAGALLTPALLGTAGTGQRP